MAKLTAWLVALLGLFMVVLLALGFDLTTNWAQWVLAIVVLVIGIGKLARNYKKRK